MTKMKVISASNIKAAPREYSPRACSVAVRAHTATPARAARSDDVEDPGTDDRANDLGHDIAAELGRLHPAREKRAKTDRRVQMRPGNRAEAVSDRDDGNAECQRNAHKANAARQGGNVSSIRAGDHR